MFLEGVPVYSPTNISTEYDLIFVAVSNVFSNEIYQTIQESNIPLDKVCFMNLPLTVAVDQEKNFQLARQFLSEETLEMVDIRKDTKSFLLKDLETYKKLNTRSSFQYDEARKYWIGNDKYAANGQLDYIYFFQDIWAARKIYRTAPKKHYDIGSRVDGFISHLLSFRENITLIDIRPLNLQISGLEYIQADATSLDGIADNSLESVSALHSLEHFGLGRYGDPVDPEACFKAFAAIQKKMAPGGNAYISVPVGEEHVEFNAHRVFYARTIVAAFSKMDLVEFSVVEGKNKKINTNVPLNQYDGYYAGTGLAGLFHFRKP